MSQKYLSVNLLIPISDDLYNDPYTKEYYDLKTNVHQIIDSLKWTSCMIGVTDLGKDEKNIEPIDKKVLDGRLGLYDEHIEDLEELLK